MSLRVCWLKENRESWFVGLSFLIVFDWVMRDLKPFTGIREEINGLNKWVLKANFYFRRWVYNLRFLNNQN